MAAYKKITMPIIDLTAGATSGKIRLELDTSNLNKMMMKANKCVFNAAQKDEIMIDMAEHVVVSAWDLDLIPYKKLYRIKSKPGKKLIDKMGRPVKFKSGKRKGEIRHAPFTPAQYFYLETIRIGEALTHDNTTSYFEKNFVSSDILVTDYNRNNKLGVRARTQRLIKNNAGEDVVTRGTGEETYGSKVRTRKKRVYWQDVGDADPVYNRSFTSILEKHVVKKGKNKGKEYSKKKYYSDRTPHLQDIGDVRERSSTHFVTIAKHKAQIRINVRKPADSRFYEEGGENYAYRQYYTPDKKWKRISTYTEGGAVENTSASGRWLELAIGLPIPNGYKKRSLGKTATQNYKDMVQILRDEVNKELGKLK